MICLEVLALMDDKEDGRAQPEAGTSSREAGGEGLVQVTLSLEVPSGAQGTTGFLLFSNVHRERVKEALKAQLSADEKVTIAAIAKQIGMLWKQCDDEVKAAYADAAKVVSRGVAYWPQMMTTATNMHPLLEIHQPTSLYLFAAISIYGAYRLICLALLLEEPFFADQGAHSPLELFGCVDQALLFAEQGASPAF